MQASLEARGQVSVLQPFLERIRHHQLRFAAMQHMRQPGVRLGKEGRRSLKPRPQPAVIREASRACTQLRLVDVRRDYSRFERRRHGDYDNPALIAARRAAALIAEARGWTLGVQADVDRALVILLSGHADGDTIAFSELFPALRRHSLSAERTIEVLQRVHLFDDDRTPSFESWLERKLAGLAPGIRRDVEHWVRTLRDGGPRSQPRSLETVWGYLSEIQPILVAWSSRYDHLREVTRNDILGAIEWLHGCKRRHTLSVLRSLFRHCKKRGSVFADPAARIPVGRQEYGVILSLQTDEVQGTLRAATTPVTCLVLALAAVHAARPKAILQMHLEDIDLGNRRLVVAGRVRPLMTSPAGCCSSGSSTAALGGRTRPTCT